MTINMTNILKGLAVAVCFSTLLTACTKNFEYFNTNQHQATEEQMGRDDLKTGALFAQMLRAVYVYNDGIAEHYDSDYQIAYNLLADSYAGYLAPTIASNGGVHCGSYFMTESWRRAMFNYSYTRGISSYVQLVREAADREQVIALANIVKVAIMHRVTDYYGPVPYSKIGSSLAVDYDAQDAIYAQFFQELGDAIDVLNAFVSVNPTGKLLDSYDIVYGGDVTKWIRFANSLRLRLAMRVYYADEELAKSEAEKSINDVTGVITAAADAAMINPAYTSYTHPVKTINVSFNDGDTQMGASMDSYLNGYKDPRLPKYFKEAGKGGYHGVRNGIHTTVWDNYRNGAGLVSAPNMDDAKLVWMAASEVAFLRAEYELHWGSAASAKDFYETGIRLSFEETGAGAADAYIANSKAVPADFTDNTKGGGNIAAMSDITVAWDASADEETNLERIITQKWIALYPNGCEAWAEYRRTGYPALFPVMNNDSEGAVNTALQIRRVAYPHDEYTNNAAGIAVGLSKLGGSDNAGTKLWWDKKSR